MDPFWEAVRMKVCRTCVDGDGAGHCTLPRNGECMMKSMVTDVFRLLAVEGLRWSREPAREVQARMCSRCSHKLSDGGCYTQRRGECTLDRYLPDLVAIVQSLGDVRSFHSAGSPG